MRLSISRIKAFKSCRRMYELKYIEGLEPVKKPEALETGSTYHSLLEGLNSGIPISGNSDFDEIFTKEMAMARAYEKYVYPNFKVVEAEKWVEMDLCDGDKLVGIVDGIADDGHIVEHKSTSMEITEEYEYNLLWDEQILAYMLMTGMRKVWYTICRKPTIRQERMKPKKSSLIAWWNGMIQIRILKLGYLRSRERIKRLNSFDRSLIA